MRKVQKAKTFILTQYNYRNLLNSSCIKVCFRSNVVTYIQEIYRPGTNISEASNLCMLKREEIKTKNSGATHHLCGGGENKNIFLGMNIMIYDYETYS